MEGAFIFGPNGRMEQIIGPRGTTPECSEAKFKRGDVVRIRRLKHLKHLPERAVVFVAIPPGFSPDWAMADLRKEPRPLMCQVGARVVTYIVGFEDNPRPWLFKERYLLPTGETAETHIEGEGDGPDVGGVIIPDPDDRDYARCMSRYGPSLDRCAGGRQIVPGYVCPHCGSKNPKETCESPRTAAIEALGGRVNG